jgi:hypothetical protein
MTLTDRLAQFFTERPSQWVDGRRLSEIAGATKKDKTFARGESQWCGWAWGSTASADRRFAE